MVRNVWVSAGLAVVLAVACRAQAPAAPQAGDDGAGHAQRRGGGAGMGRLAGEVTAINGNTITVRTEEGTARVVTTDNTRFMKEQGPVKLADLHIGDGLMAIGNLDAPNHTLHAAMVMAEDAAQVKAMKDNLGKTYITGRVTAVNLDDARMTVERPDHVSQTIGFDETTSFKRAVRPPRTANTGEESGAFDAGSGGGAGTSGTAGRGAGPRGGGMGMMAGGAGLEQAFSKGESITLADIKVGDRVVGSGSVKGGVFVPQHLLDGPAGGRRRDSGEPGGAGAATGSPGPSGR